MGKKEDKEKEQAEKMKALRRELEEKLEEQLPAVMLEEPAQVQVQSINDSEPLAPEQAKKIIEALLFAASKPMTVGEIRKVLKTVPVKEIESLIAEISAEYVRDGRSFEIVPIAGGYEICTKKEFAPWIFRVELQKKAKQVTQSALETLAILAYKQPITRAEIEELRGVDVSGVMTTLTERNFIKIVGKKEVPGRPFLYGTTEKFLEHFGLKSLEEMPNIQEIKNIVENSVKKEELLGTQKLVPVSQEENAAGQSAVDADTPASPEQLQEEASEIAEEAEVTADESPRGADESEPSAQ